MMLGNNMTDFDELYRGREQSRVKHFILQRYLTEMAFKVAQSGKGPLTPINYVDAFSGPWETQDEAGHVDTSFRQSIETLRGVRAELQKLGRGTLPVRFIFCEKNRARYEKLKQAVVQDEDFEIHCIHGCFEEKLDEISGLCKDGFTFTFIDPTGFKLKTQEISTFLSSHRGEFLWNYMADHANRFVTREGLEDAYGALLADEKWLTLINSEDWAHLSNEQRVLAALREKLKELGCASYVLDFPVMNPRKNRINFRLLFGTRNFNGVAVFRAAQKAAEKEQAKLREQIHQNEKTGPTLFSPEDHAGHSLIDEGIDGTLPFKNAQSSIIAYLQREAPTSFKNLVAPILEAELLTETGLKRVLLELRKSGSIGFELPEGKRTLQPDTLVFLNS